MPVKAPVKKITKGQKSPSAHQTKSLKPVKKTVKKPPKKVTLDDLLQSQNEAWAAIRETQKAHKETEKAIKETQKNIGGLNNTLGFMVERIMTPDLPQKFKHFGFTFDKITTIKWTTNGNVYAEIDGLLENGAQAMAVEVKTTLEIEDINDHLKRMEKIRKYADEHGDKREFLCAIAAMIVRPKPKEYALKQGLFVIEPSGEDVKVIKPETKPRVW
jgi:hypothetical protein